MALIPRSRVAFAALAVLTLSLPFAGSSACSTRTACFAYSQAQFAKHGNACPAQKDALPNFSDPSCPGPIVAVDSAGEFDGQICCYTVTYDDIVPDCGQGQGGQGGFNNSSNGPFTASAVGVGGGPASCVATCAEALTNGGSPCPSSGGSFQSYQALQTCAGCNGVGNCVNECSLSLCQNIGADSMCTTCLGMLCSTEHTSCANF